MRQLCNLAYHQMIDGKSAAQIAEIDTLLTDPQEREMAVAEQNRIAMEALLSGPGMLGPPPRRRGA
jgi:hypothetical protein